MKPTPILASLATLILTSFSFAADAPVSASDLAAKLSAVQQDGESYIRLRMEVGGAKKETLQLQIKQRRIKAGSEVLYQVLFPKERKGEAVLLRKIGSRPATGSTLAPGGALQPISRLQAPLFGGELTYEDIIDNFFGWEQQAIVGTETVDGVSCQILESRPGKGNRSSYGSVKSWVDVRRTVPLKVEKYSESGQLVRQIVTTKVVTDGGRHIPANLSVSGSGKDAPTIVEGSRIRHDVKYGDTGFSEAGVKDITVPKGGD